MSECKKCGLARTKEDHDGCLGTLAGIMNACCGHGENNAYVQFLDGNTVQGEDALVILDILKRTAKDSDVNWLKKVLNELAELKRQNEITESINTQMAIQLKSLKQERSLFTSIVFKKGNKSVPNFDTEEECLAWLDHFTPPQEAE